MPQPAPEGQTKTKWSKEFETLRREKLFRDPPRDHTPYPALKAAVAPHIESFNAIFGKDGLIAQAVRDIGPKTFLDGDSRSPPTGKNRLTVRIKDVQVSSPQLPTSNKVSKVREILPAECRERHVTYRGKIRVRLELSINGDPPREIYRDFGHLPLVVLVSHGFTC